VLLYLVYKEGLLKAGEILKHDFGYKLDGQCYLYYMQQQLLLQFVRC
jgi:hypothetical protein